jgi:phenylalanine-4-hydroxylase
MKGCYMDVLKILKERKRVLKHAYRITGASNQYYRLEELDYLVRFFKEELNKDRGKSATGLAKGGQGSPQRAD